MLEYLDAHPRKTFGFIQSDPLINPPFQLLDLGYEARTSKAYHYDNQQRSDFSGILYQYTLSGHGQLSLEGQTYTMGPGQAMLLSFPNNYQYGYPEEGRDPWVFFYIHFDGSGARQFYNLLLQTNEHQTKSPSALLDLPKHSTHLHTFLSLYHLLSSGKKFLAYEKGTWLHQFLAQLSRDLEEASWQETPTLVHQAKEWLDHHYKQGLNLSDMSQELGRSLPHITREFKKSTGLTPVTYLKNLRIEASLSLLLSSPLPIEEIAKEVGFSDANYFAKVFRKVMGQSPSSYRARPH